jgi:hypothetical protein
VTALERDVRDAGRPGGCDIDDWDQFERETRQERPMEAEEPIHEHGGDDVDCGIESFSRDESSEQRQAHGQLENVRKHADGEGQFDPTRRDRVRTHALTTLFQQQRFTRVAVAVTSIACPSQRQQVRQWSADRRDRL